ncbi:amidase [Mesorhizobium sp. L-8-10]|uniref:amidase n=1 Tax=Mesorhizobium sp. L-8-10 TaxID=2744523 RepID=UPI0019267E87|nr:amidase [Mesorhizobium sp. L-8-10]BCH31178.1 amidase [Mesorhizobium sp. L-8-10]
MTDAEDIHWLPAWRLRELVVSRKTSAEEITARLLERISRLDRRINAFLTLAGDVAIAEARAVDRAIAEGRTPGPLAGVPVTIKDQFFTKGLRTTGGSKVFEDHIPEEDSVYVARIRAAGGVILGKTNTPEFGMYWRTVGLISGECRNPWEHRRTAGGSSGGAAAALAMGFGPLALGSDAGGSIRLPSAQCGIFGMLPSFGRVPRHGGFGSTMFFSSIGPMARDVRDAATLLQVLAGPMPQDPFCRTDAPPDYLAALDAGIKGVRVAWWDNTVAEGFSAPEVLSVVRASAEMIGTFGARLAPEPLRLDTDGVDEAWRILDFVDRRANLGEELERDPLRFAQLTPYAQTRFEWAAGVSGTEYSRAILRRARFIRSLEAAFGDYDLLLAPTIGITAPVIETDNMTQRIPALVSYTLPINFAGYCAASVPCGFVGGLPVGLQIIGRPNEEALVLRAARQFELTFPWRDMHPPEHLEAA